MQLRVSQTGSRDTAQPTSAGQTVARGRKAERHDLAGLLLSLQRTRGNRFVQRMLKGAAAGRECECGGTCASCRARPTSHLLPPAPAPHREENMGEVRCSFATGELVQKLNRDHCAGDCVAQHEQEHKSDPIYAKACLRASKCLTNTNANWSWVPPEYQAIEQRDGNLFTGFCADSYNGWFNAYSDWTECQAYQRELRCLNDVIHHSCGGRRSDMQAGFGIGMGILGAVGGAIGGYFLAGALNVSQDWQTGLMSAGGGVLGGGLMGLAGVGVGSLIAGPVNEDCCRELRGENGLQAVNDSIGKHCPNAGPSHAAPLPFGEDGSIIDRRYLPGELSKK